MSFFSQQFAGKQHAASPPGASGGVPVPPEPASIEETGLSMGFLNDRSEEHTSELQSLSYGVVSAGGAFHGTSRMVARASSSLISRISRYAARMNDD